MAKVKGIFGIKGSLQNVSFYTMRGSDEIILRAKGGPKKSTIKRSARFETVRKNNNEWKGCTMLASQIKRAFGLSGLADYPVIGSLNALISLASAMAAPSTSASTAVGGTASSVNSISRSRVSRCSRSDCSQ